MCYHLPPCDSASHPVVDPHATGALREHGLDQKLLGKIGQEGDTKAGQQPGDGEDRRKLATSRSPRNSRHTNFCSSQSRLPCQGQASVISRSLSRSLGTLPPYPHNGDSGGHPAGPPKGGGGRLEATQGGGRPNQAGLGSAVCFSKGPLSAHGDTTCGNTTSECHSSSQHALLPSLTQQGIHQE